MNKPTHSTMSRGFSFSRFSQSVEQIDDALREIDRSNTFALPPTVCLRSVITQRSKTDFGRFVGESRVRERGLGVILCTYIPILRRRYVEGTSLEELLCVVYVILDEISQKSEGTHLMSLEAC